MKLESISGNDLLVNCRYSDGANGKNLLELYNELDFEVLANWRKLGDHWGYVEISDTFIYIVAYTAKKSCTRKLTLKILKRLHYPNLQCAVLAGIVDIHTMCEILKEWNNDADKSSSIFWSILEIWYWRLENNRSKQPIEDWLKSEAIDFIGIFYAEVKSAGFEREFIRWLFSKGHRGWYDLQNGPTVGKQLLQLMEASVVYNWKEDLYDPTFENIDYLTFVATEINEKYPLSVKHIS